MQNPILKFRQSSIISEKPGYLSEKLKTLTSLKTKKLKTKNGMRHEILFQPPTTPPHLSRINYWGKFPTQTNFLKQYTYADFSAISQKERPACSVFCFVSSCKEANTLCFTL